MKLLFIADLHIKVGQKNVPLDWTLNRYKLFNEKIKVLQRKVDLVVLGGDVFDRVPNMEELEVYFSMLEVFDRETIIIPGNHESVKKTTTFLTNLKRASRVCNPCVNIVDDFATIQGIDFIPYNKLKEYHPADIDFHSDILVTHCRGEIPPHVKPEVPLEMFDRWKVVLAGDLHSYENSQRNILYPGSPMSTSFHRNPVDNGVIIFDTDTLKHEWVSLGLPQLLRKTIKAGDEMPRTEYDHTVYEVEGDMTELGSLENHELLDKKVTNRSHDVALMLEKDMTMAQELSEYLEFILNLSGPNIQEAMDEFKQLEARISD
jgi:DNA repair exonuclease SbcCD nuclease subunit